MTKVSNEYWISSTWFHKLDGFCESKLDTQFEIGNTISSFFMVFWGIYGIYQLPSSIYQTGDVWKIIYSLLICVGIGSILFHATLYVGFGLLDALPMLIAAFLGLLQIIEIFLRIKLIHKYISQSMYDIIVKSSNVIIMLLVLLSVVYTSLYGQHDILFHIMFSIVPTLSFVLLIWLYFDSLKKNIKSSSQYRLIYRHLWVACSSAVFAAIIWNLCERLCGDIKFMPYLPVHALWHFAISYGMYNAIQTGIFLDFNNDIYDTCGHIMVKTKEDGKNLNLFFKSWYYIVPVLYFCNDINRKTHSVPIVIMIIQ
eukprot:957139_1